MKKWYKRLHVNCLIMGILIIVGFGYLKTSDDNGPQYARQRIESIPYDLKVNVFSKYNKLKSDRVAILNIDEKSLQEYGRWPWSRQLIKKIYNRLWQAGATVVASDILFSEPETNPIDKVLKLSYRPALKAQIKLKRQELDYDNQFSNVLQKGDAILPYVFFRKESHTKGMLPSAFKKGNLNAPKTLITTMKGYLTSLPVLVKNTLDSGFISYFRDEDGVTRRLPLLLQYKNNIYYSFTIAILKAYLLEDNVKIIWGNIENLKYVKALKLGSTIIPTDLRGEVYIPFYGTRFTIPTTSIYDFLHNKKNKKPFNGKIVIIGTSAIGLGDLQATPIDPTFPGVEAQANVMQGILDNQLVYRPLWLNNDEFLLLIALGILCTIALPYLSSIKQIAFTFFILLAITITDIVLWRYDQLVAHGAVIFLMVLTIGVFNFMYGFIFTQSHERLLKGAFSRYIPPHQVKLISKDPTNFNLDGQERDMSILFSDIRGFTSISEHLDANELKKLLNEFFTPMTKDIFDCNGTIDKYVGDMIMAFWGAPLKNENHANDAIKCALKMLVSQEKLSNEFVEKGLPSFKMGIGINSGLMNVGDMGSKYRQNYTVIGDNVNLGSRLESLTKHYGVDCLISEFTVKKQTDYFCRRLDKVKVKGRETGVFIYEPLAEQKDVSESELLTTECLHQAQQYYYEQQWEKALEKIIELESLEFNNTVCQIYRDRIMEFKKNPPEQSWDGSVKLTFK